MLKFFKGLKKSTKFTIITFIALTVFVLILFFVGTSQQEAIIVYFSSLINVVLEDDFESVFYLDITGIRATVIMLILCVVALFAFILSIIAMVISSLNNKVFRPMKDEFLLIKDLINRAREQGEENEAKRLF